MNSPMGSYLLFLLSLTLAITMLVEGCAIVLMKKAFTPLPIRVLYGMGVLLVGKEQSRRRFLSRTSPEDFRRYASWVLVFGTLLLISSGVYLTTTIL